MVYNYLLNVHITYNVRKPLLCNVVRDYFCLIWSMVFVEVYLEPFRAGYRPSV